MAASYPGAIKSFRTMANKTGISYDADKTKIIFAEDFNYEREEIVAIETELGTTPRGSDASVEARLDRIDGAIPVKASGAEIDTGTNDTKFATPKAIADSGVTQNTKTQTLTNKRLTPRIGTTASSATPTPDADANDQYNVTALAEAATFGAPSGTPVNGQKLIIRIKDNATARALSYNAIYRALGVTLPTTTVISKTIYLGMIYNEAASKWDVLAVGQEA